MPRYTFNDLSLETATPWLDASTVVLISPEGPPSHRPNVIVTHDLLHGTPLEAYVKAGTLKLKKQHKRFTVHSEETTRVGERPAVLVEQSFRSPENVNVRQQQLFVEKDGVAYVLSLTQVAEDFEAQRPGFDLIRKSFRID